MPPKHIIESIRNPRRSGFKNKQHDTIHQLNKSAAPIIATTTSNYIHYRRLITILFTCLLPLFSNALPLSPSRAANTVIITDGGSEVHHVPTEEQFITYVVISITLVLLGGVFAGLTLGLMGQDEVYLRVIQNSGTLKEQKLATKVLDLMEKGKHWVLVTLLLSNVITNESLPIVLDRCLGGGWQAVVGSTVSIVLFGEIIPQSICVRYGLEVGAFFTPFVLALMYIMYPIAYPIALLLDKILGENHGTMYKKSGLKTLVTLHQTMGVDRLTHDEVTIISAVLDLKEKKVSEIMTPIENVFTMSADRVLDEKTVQEILNAGFSRIPIYLPNEPSNFIGMLLVRVLISYDPEDCLPVSSFPLATLPETSPTTSCLNILNYFQEGKSHMCIVSDTPGMSTGALGVLTLEDVIEELIGEEIVDESDVFVDIHQRIMREHPGPFSRRHMTAYFHSLYNSHKKHDSVSGNDNEHYYSDGEMDDGTDYGSDGYEIPRENVPLLMTPKVSNAGETKDALSDKKNKNTIQPSNLASDPLKVANPFVTIKKQPRELLTNGKNTSVNNSNSNLPEPYKRNINDLILSSTVAASAHNALKTYLKNNVGNGAESTNGQKNGGQNEDNRNNGNNSTNNNDTVNYSPRVTTTVQIPVERKVEDAGSGNMSTTYKSNIISSSYKPADNGIVESVVQVKGVSKTVIKPAENWENVHSSVSNASSNSSNSKTIMNGNTSIRSNSNSDYNNGNSNFIGKTRNKNNADNN
ncbi:Mam3p SCDLUD_002557 [Saccharomycodes ludwigii]|uniref:Mam3p n=1 Tax=Saccharomycodes ludwigii TaxID=36035 RepID=UPI001E845EC4|nr:hypothetical protein SCDLUD_002557 [Saccharomycodes ludwigii]KAH3901082.1 hypothetical protein SCDLUD_002557 [Saccharomycodes ludwigii]